MSEFWLGVTVSLVGGGIVGLIVTVLANLAHPKILAYLDSRKLLSIEKRKRAAAKLHSLIVELHNGRRDRHIYMLRMAIGMLFAFVFGLIMMVGAAVIIALSPKIPQPLEFNYATLKPFMFASAMMLFSGFGVSVASLGIRRFREITNALENFEEYDAAFKQKWGP